MSRIVFGAEGSGRHKYVVCLAKEELDVLAAAAHRQFASLGGREAPPWDSLPEEVKTEWRTVAYVVVREGAARGII